MAALRFGMSRAQGSGADARRFLDTLGARLEQTIKLIVVPDYDKLVEGIGVGGLDLAWMPPLLHQKANEALLAAVCERGGAVVYRAAILVRSDSSYRTVRELRGARAAWSDRSSASGCLFPRLHLRVGNNAQLLGSESFAGSPIQAMQAVVDGQADLCSCFVRESAEDDPDLALADIRRRFLPAERLRVLAVTDLIPPDGMVLAPSLDGNIQARIRDVLLGLHDGADGAEALLALLDADKLVPVTGHVARTIDRLRARLARLQD